MSGIWIARRDANKPMYPNMLDNAVGEAVKHDEVPFQSLVREAKEELGIDAEAAASEEAISWFSIKDARSGIEPGLVEPGVQHVYDREIDAKVILNPVEAGIE